MITYVIGGLLQSPARVLVNPVNTVGVMGKGLAYDFKVCFPRMFERYQALCRSGDFGPGRLMLHRTVHKQVLNFPVKRHWRAAPRLDDIEAGLQNFAAAYAERGITSASFPRLGCEFGELDWDKQVRPLMEKYLAPLPVAVYIHHDDPSDPFAPAGPGIRAVRAWLEGVPQPVSFGKFWRDIGRLLGKSSRFTTPDGAFSFTVGRDTRRKGRNLAILTPAPQPLFISESQLMELWAYVRSAGYCLPSNLPGGLDAHAGVVAGLLSALGYVRPVHLMGEDGRKHVGMHYVPPVERHGDVAMAALEPNRAG